MPASHSTRVTTSSRLKYPIPAATAIVLPDDIVTAPPDTSPRGGVSIVNSVTSVSATDVGPMNNLPVWMKAFSTGSENVSVKFGLADVSTKARLAEPLNVPSVPLFNDCKSRVLFSYNETASMLTVDGVPESPIKIPVAQ